MKNFKKELFRFWRVIRKGFFNPKPSKEVLELHKRILKIKSNLKPS